VAFSGCKLYIPTPNCIATSVQTELSPVAVYQLVLSSRKIGFWLGTMKSSLLMILLESILLCTDCQTSFTVTRYESGDEVQSSMTSAAYCSAIRGYLDGSQCKCNYRRTFSLESQTCIDYYNGTELYT